MQTTEAYPPRSRFIGFIAVYGNVSTRRATTVSTSTTLKYRAYRSFHRRFYKRVSRNRPIKKKKKCTDAYRFAILYNAAGERAR
ncbi:hypothetical protein ALC60_11081 [Trachymyrmex zeteki]|uniref:Uncharacterized protein n=1 Tax=Mycetomoellerius zeteki TaxID=64791 RepID=A0A151WPW4_9HYME|nr:hypothetical protein ALC60_11081 [Trachymyrmex zeteki]